MFLLYQALTLHLLGHGEVCGSLERAARVYGSTSGAQGSNHSNILTTDKAILVFNG